MNDQEGVAQAGSVAFLLAQLGAHAAMRFAERIAELELTAPQAGVLRAVAADPGRTQQAIAAQLGIAPSGLLVLLDELERRGLLARRRNPHDRRQHAVDLTDPGRDLLARVAVVARAHDDALLAALDPAERQCLRGLLGRIAAQQQLTDTHPGFRRIGGGPAPRSGTPVVVD